MRKFSIWNCCCRVGGRNNGIASPLKSSFKPRPIMPCHNPFGRRWLFIMAVLITFVLFLLLKWFEGFPYYNNLLAHQQLNKTESNKLRIGTSETEKDSGPMEEGQNQNNEQVGEEEVSEAQAKEKEVGNKELENLKYEAETNKTDERQQVC